MTYRIDTGGKGWRAQKRAEELPPLLPISGFLFIFFFFIIFIFFLCLSKIKWSVCISKSHSLCQILGSAYPFIRMVKFQFLAQFLVDHLTHSVLLIIIIITPPEFFTSVLADGFSMEFEWQQVSSSIQDSSQYSGRPHQCCRLDSLYPSANFQVLQAF